MLSSIKKLLGAVALVGLFSTGPALANVPIYETTGTVNSQSSFVANAYGFQLDGPGWYQATLTDYGNPQTFEALTLNILSGFSTTGLSLGGISGPGTFSFLANSAGVYTALLFGIPGGANGGGSFSVSVVPEVETWVMLLIGAGLIGYQLRRKNKLQGPSMNLNFA